MRYSFGSMPECCPIKGNGDEVQLARDWSFFVDNQEIWIPAGYRFETSIPLFAQMIVGSQTNPIFWPAACAHDFCFEIHCLSFDEANDLFRTFLLAMGVPAWKYRVMRWAVSTRFGKHAYNKVIIDDLKELKKLVAGREKFEKNILVSQYGDV